jgi:RNA polymerase sigma-70 factor (ECF subfamily)
MAHATDAGQWLAAARAGSREALGQALEAFRGYLLLLAQEDLHPALRAKGGASDVVQETFLEAQRDFQQFRGDSEEELRAWLRQLLHHNLANFTRRYCGTGKRAVGRERALQPGGSSDELGGQLPGPPAEPSRLAVAKEQAQALWRGVDRLPDDYRQVLLLRYQDRLSFEEIAERMGRSAAAVRQLWARAVRRIRLEMEQSHEHKPT